MIVQLQYSCSYCCSKLDIYIQYTQLQELQPHVIVQLQYSCSYCCSELDIYIQYTQLQELQSYVIVQLPYSYSLNLTRHIHIPSFRSSNLT